MKVTLKVSPLIDELINALRCLPGVGPKTAQRMAFYLLQRDQSGASRLAHTVLSALQNIKHCRSCRNLCENEQCHICLNPKRDQQLLCIVESPMDVLAIEQTTVFSGHYFILHGHLSPLDGIGPDQLGINELQHLLVTRPLTEVIIATNPTVEGEATAHFLRELIKPLQIKTTRIAHGVPIGGELEYIDGGTIARALSAREII